MQIAFSLHSAPGAPGMTFSDLIHRGEGLCTVEEDDIEHAATLGGRLFDPQHVSIDIVNRWLSICERQNRIDCTPFWSHEIQDIRLLDVMTWQVVRYPKVPCDYIALSYIWGIVAHQRFQLGSVVDQAPQTIEDAIYHHLLLRHFRGNIATGGTTLSLLVAEDELQVLEELLPRKQRLVLA